MAAATSAAPAKGTLEPQHAALLSASAISEETAAARGYFSATEPEQLAALGFEAYQQRVPALVIPIRDVSGEIALYQARPDDPRMRRGKPVKYDTPKGQPLAIDVPAAALPALTDASVPLWVTEGSRKVDAATSLGLCCIGVIGVDGWRHRPDGDAGPSVPRPAWEAIRLAGRKVYVAFDSDVTTKPSVRNALEALRAFLDGEGAEVRIVQLPHGEDGKVGLDDYIAADHGRDDLLELAQRDLPETASGNGRGPTHAEQLVTWVTEGGAELFHDPERKPWATVTIGDHRETISLESTGFRDFLGRAAHENGVVGEQAVKDATARLRAVAIYDGEEHEIHTRLAFHDGAIYLDLGDERRRTIEIRADGWHLLDGEPPVKFRRPGSMRPLPVPTQGGNIEALRWYVNVSDEDSWRLLVGWLVGALAPTGPYPLLVLHGEQGSAKSTTARMLRALIDPGKPELRSAPGDERELLIAATNNRIVAFDNLSGLGGKDAWLSDALCRLSTGGGLAVRALYKNDEEQLFEVASPVILTGIEAAPQRPDLLERSILVELSPLSDEKRQAEAELWRGFEQDRPQILGALLDAGAAALRNRGQTQSEDHALPRMADHAIFVTAAESGLDWEAGAYLASYAASREATTAAALDSSPLWPHLATLADDQERTAQELLDALGELAGDAVTRLRAWPKQPHILSAKLRRIAPDLRRSGVETAFGTAGRGDGRRKTITLSRSFQDQATPATPATPSAPQSEIPGSLGVADEEAGSLDV